MLKKTETEGTRGFFVTFLSLVKFQLGRGGPPAILPLATPMLQVRKTKKVLAIFPRGFWRLPTKFQLFKKQCCPRAEDRAIFEDLRLRGQGQGLDLRGQGQGLQNVSSRPRTSSRAPPLIIIISNKNKGFFF